MHAWSPTLQMDGKDDFHKTEHLSHKGRLNYLYPELVSIAKELHRQKC